jgi:uncharacterized protein
MATLVLGASENPARYSNMAVLRLLNTGHKVYAYSIRKGNIHGLETIQHFPEPGSVHTVTLYIGSATLPQFATQIIELHPEYVIFNPGTENPAVRETLEAAGIKCIEACTLVMLQLGSYTERP